MHGKKSEDLELIKQRHEKGKIPEDFWTDLSNVSQWRNELIGYKTQKPEALIKRIISCASKENDIVLDFFGGGGTTAKVAHDLKRRFIIGDVSPVAIRVIGDRLISNGYSNYEIKALPSTKEEYLLIDGHKFADMMCEFMGWKSNIKKSGDGGIDGFADGENIPIQIKNHKQKTGRPDIQKFLGAIHNRYKKGFFVSWGFSPEAWEYKATLKNTQIEFFEAGKLLNGLLISDGVLKDHKKLYEQRVKKAFSTAGADEQAGELVLKREKKKIQWEKEKQRKIKKRKKF